MNAILVAILLSAASPSLEVQTLDGQTLVGRLAELTADRVTIDGPDSRVSLDTQRLLSISARQKSASPRVNSGIVVELVDGSLIAAEQYLAKGAQAKIALADGETLETPTSAVRSVRLQQDAGTLGAEWARLVGRKSESDLLVIKKDQNVDYHEGVIHDVTNDVVQFDLDGDLLPVKRSKVFGLAYRHRTEAELPAAVCRITDAEGSQWSVRSLSFAEERSSSGKGDATDNGSAANRPHPGPLPAGEGTLQQPAPAGEGTLRWTTPSGLTISRTIDKIVQIDFSGGKIAYLSDLKPDDVRWTPYFEAGKPPPAVAQFFAPRRDRSFDGGPLLLGGTHYRKGLALHGRTELTFRLPDQFSHFRAMVGIDDAVRPGGKVRLLIHGDGRELLNVALAGNDPPRPVDLDMTGVRRLTIEVDFAEGLSTGDYLLLCNARLSK